MSRAANAVRISCLSQTSEPIGCPCRASPALLVSIATPHRPSGVDSQRRHFHSTARKPVLPSLISPAELSRPFTVEADRLPLCGGFGFSSAPRHRNLVLSSP